MCAQQTAKVWSCHTPARMHAALLAANAGGCHMQVNSEKAELERRLEAETE